MIKLSLKMHEDDSEMIEIRTFRDPKRPLTTTILWAVFQSDMIHDDEIIREKVKTGEPVDVYLTASPFDLVLCVGTLKRSAVELANILDCVELHADHRAALLDLNQQLLSALTRVGE